MVVEFMLECPGILESVRGSIPSKQLLLPHEKALYELWIDGLEGIGLLWEEPVTRFHAAGQGTPVHA